MVMASSGIVYAYGALESGFKMQMGLDDASGTVLGMSLNIGACFSREQHPSPTTCLCSHRLCCTLQRT